MLDLTIVIPVKNEAQHLEACLDSIGKDFAKHIVVVDSESTDNTPKIAREWGAAVVDFQWDGHFPKKRNWFLRNHTPSTEWVFFLDADEHLTPAFKKELTDELPGSNFSGYWLRYTIYFLGKELKYGYPLKKLALFKVGAGEYERIDENAWSQLDMEVHEHPMIDGTIGLIKSKIDHRDFRPISHYIAKHNDYASWEASRFIADEYKEQAPTNSWKQRLKRYLKPSPFLGPIYFLGTYFLYGGILDGTRGLLFAILKSAYFSQISAKILEARSLKPSPPSKE